ncbi:MAG: N-acetylmuramoyl-L-alanine amidase [Chloroflexi bacterium]|nr:N-acetylmuramoyl-L-alanine amidase [Chloroflexota bacterium]
MSLPWATRRMTRLTMFGLPLLLAGAALAGLLSFNDSAHRPKVVLDPGHGGDELGAVEYGLVERDLNLDMAKRVGALLTAAGIDVVYTRTDDGRAYGERPLLTEYSATFADLEERIEIANETKADLFVSIHSNAFGVDRGARGIEVYYNPDRAFAARSRELAEAIRAGVVSLLEAHGYQAPPSRIEEDIAITDAAGRTTPYLVLGGERELKREEMDERGGDWDALGYGKKASVQTRATQMPGVLLELLYLSNEEDVALLRDDSARHHMAEGIADGILRTLGRR